VPGVASQHTKSIIVVIRDLVDVPAHQTHRQNATMQHLRFTISLPFGVGTGSFGLSFLVSLAE